MKRRHRLSRKEKSWERLIYYQTERQERATRKLLAAIPPGARAVKLRARRDPTIFRIIAPSAYPADLRSSPGDRIQATRFDKYGPSGHFDAPDMETAIRTLSGEPFRGPAWGSPGEWIFESAR